jgi:hypothetical protein
MSVRRRSRRRPLTEFAKRSPLHALGVWLLRSGLIALLFLGLWLLITTWAVPSLSESLTR